nr:unnamed protein product [Callosobruchus analis]
MDLIVDKPKPGYDSSNNGNTALRFFEYAEISSSIMDIEVEVIKRFRTILIAIASGFPIERELFQAYAIETAHLFVEKYKCLLQCTRFRIILLSDPPALQDVVTPDRSSKFRMNQLANFIV